MTALLLSFISFDLFSQNAFSESEREWIAEHPLLKVSNEMDWPPFDFVDRGSPAGYSVEYMELIAGKIGVDIQWINGYSWDELLLKAENREIDVMQSIARSPERERFLSFSKSYVNNPRAIFVRPGSGSPNGLKDLSGRSVAVVEGFVLHSYLEKNFPDIDLVFADNSLDGLTKVIYGEAYAYIDRLNVINYLIAENHLSGVAFGSLTGIAELDSSPLYIAVRKDWEELVPIINKAMALITDEEREKLDERWFSTSRPASDPAMAGLTAEEKQWIAENPLIRVHNEMNWAPFNFNKYDTPQGFSIDFMDKVAEAVGLKVQFVWGPSWDEFLSMIRKGELDVMLNIAYTEERDEYLRYTDPYLEFAPSIYIREGEPSITSIEEVFGKKFAIPKGFYYEDLLREYPQIELVSVEGTAEAILAVSRGEADIMLDLMPIVNYLTNSLLVTNLKPGGTLGIDENRLMTAHLGIREDYPLLHSILQKGMRSLSESEKFDMRRKWLDVSENQNRMGLTPEEREYIRNNPLIRVGNEMDWPPFDFNVDGVAMGFSVDYMNYLAQSAGFEVEYVSGPTWSELLGLLERGEMDMILNIVKTESRERYISFTDPYIRNPNVLVSSAESPMGDLGELEDKVLAVGEGFFYQEVLEKNFPEIRLLLVDNILEGLKAVTTGRADAALGEQAVVSYLINENFLSGLHIVSADDLGDDLLEQLCLGIRKDLPVLYSIIGKAMAEVPESTARQMREKWLAAGESAQIKTSDDTISDEIPLSVRILRLSGIIAFFLLFIYLLQRILRKNVMKGEKFDIRRMRIISSAVLIFILIIIAVLATIVLDQVKKRVVEDLESSLQIVLNSTEESLDLWIENNFLRLQVHSQSSELKNRTEELLTLPKEQLVNSESLQSIRNYMIRETSSSLWKDFFIINRDGINIAAFDNSFIGAESILNKRHVYNLDRVFSGESQFIPSVFDDDVSVHFLYFAVPVFDEEGSVSAVLAYREKSSLNFSSIFQQGVIGATGETYAFDQWGIMLTESRFKEELIELGLIDSDSQGNENIVIRDPGGDLTKGYLQELPSEQWPFTKMILNALSGNDGFDVRGYRDYRGVEVYGTWLWDNRNGIGLATEIDVRDALSSYYMTRNSLILILAAVIIMVVGSTVFSIVIGEKANNSLKRSNDELESRVDDRTSELSEAKRNLEITIEALTHPFYVIDAETYEIVLANSAARKVARGEDISTCYRLTHKVESPCQSEEHPCPLKLIRETGEPVTVEHIHFNENDEPRYMEVHGYPIFNDQGKVVRMIEYSLDVTERKEAESQIVEARNKTAAVLDASTNGIITINEKGIIESFNRAAEIIFQFDSDQVIGENVSLIMPEEHGDNHDQYISNYLESGIKKVIGKRLEIVGKRKSGEHFPLEIGINEVLLENKRLFTAICNDITERKKAEEDLKRTNQVMEFAAETARLAHWELDLENLNFTFNDQFFRLLDTTVELEGGYKVSAEQYMARYPHPDDRDMIKGKIGAALESRSDYYDQFEFRINTRDNILQHVFIKYLVLHDEDNKPVQCIGIHLDISEQKKTEEDLIRSKKHAEELSRDYSNFMESTSDLVYLKDQDLRYLAVSRPLADMLGYSEWRDIIGKTEEEIQNENSTIQFSKEPEIEVLNGIEMEFTEDILDKGDDKGWVSTVKKPLRDSIGNIVGVLSLSRDITKQKQIEQELRDNLEELELFNQLTIGREERMIELKEEINTLLLKMGKESKYEIVDDEVEIL